MSFKDNQTTNNIGESLLFHSTELVSGFAQHQKYSDRYAKPVIWFPENKYVPKDEVLPSLAIQDPINPQHQFNGFPAISMAEINKYNNLLNIVDSGCGFVTLKDTKFQSKSIVEDSVYQNYVKIAYYRWVKEDCYMLLNNDTQGKTYAIKACKRGNDKYHKRVKARFGALMDLPDIQFFKPEEIDEVHDTKLLFITLTYAHARCRGCGSPQKEGIKQCPECGSKVDPFPLRDAWSMATADYNRYVTYLREKYGQISLVRVIEAQNNGYPHIHIIAMFHDAEFTAFKHDNIWRILEKNEVSEQWSSPEYQGIGHVDIEAGYSLRGLLSYVVKYLNKMHDMDHVSLPEAPNEDHCSELGDLVSRASLTTLSMLWVHGIRSFAISKDWLEAVNDSIEAKHISKPVSTAFIVDELGELGFEAMDPDKWTLLGFFHGSMRRGSRGVWSTELSGAEVKHIRGLRGFVSHQAMDYAKEYAKGWCDIECAWVPGKIAMGAM